MNNQIFVNLAVKDLERAKKFFTDIGYTFNPQFTDSNAACLVIKKDCIYAMLLTEPFMKTFLTKDLANTNTVTETLIALSCESKEEVDKMVEKVLKAGGKEHKPKTDMGFMYSCSMMDLDGHIWEYVWMDPTHLQN